MAKQCVAETLENWRCKLKSVVLVALVVLNLTRYSPIGREFFLVDPEFPRRLHTSGYGRTIDFVQFLFEKYAQSGLTEKLDRTVAISGLVERMESAFRTKCRYGVFEAFLYRLLLWRRHDKPDSNETHYKDQRLPSWSWMTYSRIHFLLIDHAFEVPAEGELRFDTNRQSVLLVQVRSFQKGTTVQKGSGYTIMDKDSVNVGVLSFDMPTDIHFQHCVVIGLGRTQNHMEEGVVFGKDGVVIGLGRTQNHMEDAQRIYYILLLKKIESENKYERVGLGEIKAGCVSEDYREGELY